MIDHHHLHQFHDHFDLCIKITWLIVREEAHCVSWWNDRQCSYFGLKLIPWPIWSQTHSQLNPHTLINLSGQTHSATTLNWMMSKEKQGRVGKSKRFCIKMWNCIFSRKHPLFSALKCTDRYTFIGMPCWSWAELILPPSRFLSTVQFSLDSFVRRIFQRRFHFNLSTALPSAPCRWPGGWVGGSSDPSSALTGH